MKQFPDFGESTTPVIDAGASDERMVFAKQRGGMTSGLRMVRNGMVVYCVGQMIGLMPLIAVLQADVAMGQGLAMIVLLGAGISVISALLIGGGLMCCLSAPKKSRCHSSIEISLTCGLLATFFLLAPYALDPTNDRSTIIGFFLVGGFTALLSQYHLIAVIQRLAVFATAYDAIRTTDSLLKAFVGLFILFFLAACSAAVSPIFSLFVTAVTAFITVVIIATGAVATGTLLSELRKKSNGFKETIIKLDGQ